MSIKKCYLIGIDEVGRGPIAGPTTVGAVMIEYTKERYDYLRSLKIRDSKKLNRQKREEWLLVVNQWKKEGWLSYKYSFVSAGVIDRIGINKAIKTALIRNLQKLKPEEASTLILLDGGLYAPKNYTHQQTIIKGDEREPIIALASIVAKVNRDAYMERKSLEYPEFAFHEHKGYGTDKHYKNIRKYGTTPLHRQSFLK